MPKIEPTDDAITAEDFAKAKAYFNSFGSDPVKFRRKKFFNAPNHSFILVGGEIYALKKGGKLGQGAFGTVRYAQNAKGDRFAIKVLENSNPAIVGQEARALEELNQGSGISASRESDSKKNSHNKEKVTKTYVVMKHLGQPIQSVIDRTNDAQCLDFAIQTAIAVHNMHVQGYYHRDIKPDNLTVDDENQVHLIDFGLSDRQNELSVETKGTPSYWPRYIYVINKKKYNYRIPHRTNVVPYLDSIALLGTLKMPASLVNERTQGILQEVRLPPCIQSIFGNMSSRIMGSDISTLHFFQTAVECYINHMVIDLGLPSPPDAKLRKALFSLLDNLVAQQSIQENRDIIQSYCRETPPDTLSEVIKRERKQFHDTCASHLMQSIQDTMQGITPLFIAALLIAYQKNPRITEEEVQALKVNPEKQRDIVRAFGQPQEVNLEQSIVRGSSSEQSVNPSADLQTRYHAILNEEREKKEQEKDQTEWDDCSDKTDSNPDPQ